MARNPKAPPVAKMDADARAAVHMVFDGLGGVPRLIEWANQPQNIDKFYTQIWPKVIPRNVSLGDNEGKPVRMVIEWGEEQPKQLKES